MSRPSTVIVGPATWAQAERDGLVDPPMPADAGIPLVAHPPTLVDVRKDPTTRNHNGPRPIESITGITLHQAAVVLEREPKNPAYHVLVQRRGRALLLRDLGHQMHQAQRVFNRSDVGIEFSGYYAGVAGDLRTFWKPKRAPKRKPQQLTAAAIAAGLDAIRWIIAEVAAHGGQIRHIHAHRQTSRSRTSDPGSQIWQTIALPIMDEFGLDHLIETGDGRLVELVPHEDHPIGNCYSDAGPGWPIPREWDPRRTTTYRERGNP